MSAIRKLPPFERSLAAIMIVTREAVIAPMRGRLRAFGMTEPQWRVLRILDEHGALDAKSLAEIGLMHAPSVSRILRELEDRKLIVRDADTRDRRRMFVRLSSDGEDMNGKIQQELVGLLNQYSKKFGKSRLKSLAKDLKDLADTLNSSIRPED